MDDKLEEDEFEFDMEDDDSSVDFEFETEKPAPPPHLFAKFGVLRLSRLLLRNSIIWSWRMLSLGRIFKILI